MKEFKCSIEPVLTPEYVADLFQVSVHTVKYWLRSGKLEGFKVGGCWRTNETCCKKFLESNKTEVNS
jgi:excisionase family DNA binding protein